MRINPSAVVVWCFFSAVGFLVNGTEGAAWAFIGTVLVSVGFSIFSDN